MTGSWILPAVLLGLFMVIAVGHAYCHIRYLARQTAFSVVPLLGGLLGAVGFSVAPEPAMQQLWWLPFLLDYGSIPALVLWAYTLVRSKEG